MTQDDATQRVMAWVRRYEQAWRSNDVGAVSGLFTPDARYRRSPYEAPEVGHDAIGAMWSEDVGQAFDVSAEPVAVQGRTAVVRLQVDYRTPPQQYRDLWLLHFAADGRVEDFEEWAYWPGAPYTAS